jgi:hypothetical protein
VAAVLDALSSLHETRPSRMPAAMLMLIPQAAAEWLGAAAWFAMGPAFRGERQDVVTLT